MRLTAILSPVCLALAASTAARLHAHGVEIDCRLASGQLVIVVRYDDGGAAAGARVELLTAEGAAPIANGTAADNGEWSIPSPPAGRYTVKADHGGHAEEVRIVVGAGTAQVEGSTTGRGDHDHQQDAPFWSRHGLKLILGVAVLALITVMFRAVRRKPGGSPGGP